MLAGKKIIIIIESTNPENLSNNEGFNGDTRLSLRRGNRIDFLDGLGAGGNQKGRVQIVEVLRGREYRGT